MIKKFIAIAAIAAMLFACGEPEEEKPNNEGPNTETPEPEEPEFVSAITIDGDYSDWAAVEVVETALPTDGTPRYEQLKKVKAYADEYFICLYLEFDPSNNIRNIDLFIDEDNDPMTGHLNGNGKWAEGVGIMMQGSFYEFNADYTVQMGGKSWAPTVYMFGGENLANTWEWVDLGVGGVASSSAADMIDDTTAAVEIQIIREMIPMPLADTIGLGVILETAEWSSVGSLPQISAEAEFEGETTHLLQLVLP